MKSLKNHLVATKSFGEKKDILRKPVYRGSGLFPAIRTEQGSTRILFMGYWLMKRQIKEIGMLITLRDELGKILNRHSLTITDSKAYRVELDDLLIEAAWDESTFIGSLDIEIFSTRDLVFPFPAFVINYYGDHHSGAVHTIGRVFNDIEDEQDNTSIKVPESGFDILGGEEYDPFFAVTNGHTKLDNAHFDYKITNANGKTKSGSKSFGEFLGYQTKFFKIKEFEDLSFLGKDKGSISIDHNFTGIFPRWACGNFKTSGEMNVTHSYYDLSGHDSEDDYWDRKDERFHDTSIMFPVFFNKETYSELVLYPIYSPCKFSVDLHIYNQDGDKLTTLTNVLENITSESSHCSIHLYDELKDRLNNLEEVKAALAIYKFESKVPTRLKTALNVGMRNVENGIPCNICFTANAGNSNILGKDGIFRWAPLLNVGRSVFVAQNGSPLKEYTQTANIKMRIVNEESNNELIREVSIKPYGTYTLDVAEDEEVTKFLGGNTGWITIQADSPFVTAWYFDFCEQSGIVGGDHSF